MLAAEGTNFNAIHAAPGAFTTLTCGHHGSAQGLAAQRGSPANQSLFIGYKPGPAISGASSGEHPPTSQIQPVYLPFFENGKAIDAEAAFDVDRQSAEQTCSGGPSTFPVQSIFRNYKYGTDEWRVDTATQSTLSFRVATPFAPIPDPEDASSSHEDLQSSVAPLVTAELRLENHSATLTQSAIFGLGVSDDEPGLADIIDSGIPAGAVGFSVRGQYGFVGLLEDDDRGETTLYPVQCFGESKIHRAEVGLERLGNTGGFVFSVAPKTKKTCRIVFASFLEGVVSTRIRASYFYCRFFSSLSGVFCFGLRDFAKRFAAAEELDTLLENQTHLNESQKLLVCHSTRAYFGSSQLLDVGGAPYYIVNEGGYVMMNTLDLSIDHMFFELGWSPWVVRNVLDNFYRFYSYTDDVVDPKTGEKFPGGISFTHDQGFSNQFSPPGYSSYERPRYSGCFSYMTQEQLSNWIIMAATYVTKTKDARWAKQNKGVFQCCLESMEQRDHPDPSQRNGIMGFDSSRCQGGQEITTYDSLDPSLKQARNNLYLSVKGLAAYLGLSLCFGTLGDDSHKLRSLSAAERVARSVYVMEKDNWIPAVFEKDSPGYQSKILPAIEGFAYVLYWAQRGCKEAGKWVLAAEASGEVLRLLEALERHTKSLMQGESNRFEDGGIKLSSTSNGSWMSKIAIFQHLAKSLYGIDTDEADAAHWKWQMDPSASRQAMCDQISAGKAVGSLYYPRCVTTALWLRLSGR